MTRTSREFLTVAAAALLVSFLTSPTVAALFVYGDFLGTSVTYVGVQENSVTDPGPLFGAPTISGNQLDFNPSGFAATATGPGGIDITDGQLNFTIWAHNESFIDNFMLSESGDYTLFGGGTIATAVSVSTPTEIEITEVDGVALVPAIEISTNMVFTPLDGNYDLINDGGIGVAWSGELMVDVTQALIDEGIEFDFGATKLNVVLDNVLVAASESGTTATIAKKDFDGFTVTTNIPEPSTFVLAGMALIALLPRRRVV